MSAVRKFLFENDFDAVPAPPKPASQPHDLGATRANEDQLRADGFAAGRAAALSDAAQQSADAVQSMAARLGVALAEADAFMDKTAEDAAELAIAAANHLAGPASAPVFAAHAKAQLAAIIAQQLGTTRLTISVAPNMQPHIQAAADHVVGCSEFAGRVTVVADAALVGCDLVIDWQNGALHELRRDRLAALAERIADYFEVTPPAGAA